MKKLLFVVILAAMCCGMTSCESKPQGTPLEGNENLLVFEKNGLFSIKQADGTPILMGNLYEKVRWDNHMGIIVADKDNETTLAWPNGHVILSDKFSKIEPAGQDFHRILLDDKYVYLLAGPDARKGFNIKGDGLWGKMRQIELQGNFIFMKGDAGWGVARIDPREGLAPTSYKSVYIIKPKSKEDFLVMVEDNKGGRALFDTRGTSGEEYKLAPKKFKKLLKKLPDKPYGVVEADF